MNVEQRKAFDSRVADAKECAIAYGTQMISGDDALFLAADAIVKRVEDENKSLLSRCEAAEAALCRARELCTLIWGHVSAAIPGEWIPLMEAVGNSAPCPHAAEVERLKGVVEWACVVALDPMKGQTPDEKRELIVELRHRAG